MEELIQKEKNYFIRLFKGEIPLVITFWIWFFFFNIIISISSSFYFNHLPINPTNNQLNISLLITFFMVMYSIFILISVWRSATFYNGSKFWIIVSKLIVIFNFFSLSYEAYKFTKIFIDKEYALTNSIEQLNNRLPLKVNEHIYMTQATIQSKSIYYTYRLNNIEKSKLPIFNISLMKDNLIQTSCKNKQVYGFLEKGYIFNYEYTNKKNEKLTIIKIAKETCKKEKQDIDILKKLLKEQ